MRVATVRAGDGLRAARVDGDELTLLPFAGVGELLACGGDWREWAGGPGPRLQLADASLAPVVPSPEKVICVGLNYLDHVRETNRDLPTHPTLFAKFWRSLIGPEDELVIPAVSERVDWEIELGVVVGAPIRDADPAEALAAVAGYTIVNDISMRDWQLRTSQYLAGKTFEASTPIGPYLVSTDEVDPAAGLAMRLQVDGETMQESSTDQMIFGVGEILSYISAIVTLVPGDLVATGTPAGVGQSMEPPRFLAAGSLVACSIEGLGAQITRCRA